MKPALLLPEPRPVAALFVRSDSIYYTLPGVDCWNIERDARQWPGGVPGVFHPPCRAWGRLAHMANPRPDEKDLARWAVGQVRRWGGVLEHPAASRLWADMMLPPPGRGKDAFDGWTLGISQHWWGHRAEKKTLLYIVGCTAGGMPDMPALALGSGTHVIAQDTRAGNGGRRLGPGDLGWRPFVTHAEREHTPPALAEWLVELARRCVVPAAVTLAATPAAAFQAADPCLPHAKPAAIKPAAARPAPQKPRQGVAAVKPRSRPRLAVPKPSRPVSARLCASPMLAVGAPELSWPMPTSYRIEWPGVSASVVQAGTVPEPDGLALVVLGLGLVWRIRRKA